ncbi:MULTISPECIES: hypothetical protein [unclassified Cryobacterium]|uniref:hypothetical protein n=2 Tax=Bacteria TaxID=2 RepID=UPI002AB38B80|nr:MULTISPECIES: hypothetical protein [unclassified Cryobacterium]MDY7527297.1 hypothetical protein [Cryobacterium sp. 10C2]MDY7556916.1 hypothetical protein [Cryobacterium sp. 10C3]MEB0003879.1 hypothetical protein [Cryobacterium sp. RTC2.1]MEB0202703.1 hypothetical protein [Cryobacterium sp. 5I3]MEB0285833.1 hypothetical protein [Cryobacterium sp. 10S3]
MMRDRGRTRDLRPRVVGVWLVLSLSAIGAAAMPSPGQAVPCDLLLVDCGVPTPTPSTTADPTVADATPSTVPTAPVDPAPVVAPIPVPTTGPTVGVTAPGPNTPAAAAVVAVADPNAPVFGNPAAQLGASSMTITGLASVTVVTVSHADGTTVPALRIVADDIVLTDAVIDVRSTSGSGLVTSSPRMELHGNVQVYLDSITTTLPDGTSVSFGAATPPPGGLPSTLGSVTLGLVGTLADSIGYSQVHQSVS